MFIWCYLFSIITSFISIASFAIWNLLFSTYFLFPNVNISVVFYIKQSLFSFGFLKVISAKLFSFFFFFRKCYIGMFYILYSLFFSFSLSIAIQDFNSNFFYILYYLFIFPIIFFLLPSIFVMIFFTFLFYNWLTCCSTIYSYKWKKRKKNVFLFFVYYLDNSFSI